MNELKYLCQHLEKYLGTRKHSINDGCFHLCFCKLQNLFSLDTLWTLNYLVMLQYHPFYCSIECRVKIFLRLMNTQGFLKLKSEFKEGEGMWCLVLRDVNSLKEVRASLCVLSLICCLTSRAATGQLDARYRS